MRFHRLLSVFRYTLGASALAVCLLVPLSATGQVNPVPFVNQPLVPTAIAPHGPGFTLTVNGSGFVPESVVNWNSSPRTTTFVSSTQLTVAIQDTDIAMAGTAWVTVSSPGPGGGTSNVVFCQITTPTSAISMTYNGFGWDDMTSSVAAGDFDSDGNLDLAISDVYGNVFTVLGNGDGTFRSRDSYSTGSTGNSWTWTGVTTGDFNRDAKLDLAVAVLTSVYILLGNGDGTFQPPVAYAGSGSYSVVTGDFNKDGALDLAQGGGVVGILLGNGDGTFQPHVEYAAGDTPLYLAVGDFNGDNNLDLAAASNWLDGITILLGNGDGTFQARGDYAATYEMQSVIAADLNGDGKLDLAAAGSWTGDLAILLGNGDGTFQYPVTYGANPYAVTSGDFNGDGKLDLTAGSIRLGNGDGTFQAGTDSLANGRVAAGDFNGDGKLDLAATGGVYLQTSDVGVSRGKLTFPDQLVGTTSAPQTVTLTNNCAVTLNISSITVAGTNSGDFAETNTCGASLAAGASCVMSVTFAPTATGQRAGAVTITDDASGSPHSVSLTGTGVNPAATLSVTSLSFGNQTLNTTSASQVVTLRNSGVEALTITSIAASADFEQNNDCGTTVAEGAQCTISVTFTPTVAGIRTGAIIITDNAADSPQAISLSGTGVPATLTLSTTSLTFGEQNVGTTSAPQTVTVTNSGTGPLAIFSIGASGNFAATHNCPISPATLGPSLSCTINVTFRPTEGGTRTGSLTLADNASGSPHTVSLTGTGVPPTISVLPPSLDFGDQRVGTTSTPQAVTVTNTGGGPATIISISTSAEFTRTSDCPQSPATLAAAASCTINVTFTPSARGTCTGSLTLADNATGSPHTVSLAGNGLAPEVGLSPTALNFPDQVVGVTSPPQDVTLSNTGNTVLNITGFLVTSPFGYVSECGTSVAVGANCTITVTFIPNVAGTTYGALIISDDAAGSPHTVSLAGTTAVNFGQQPVGQTSAPQIVSLTNTSGTTRVISGVSTTGDFAHSSTCGTLATGQSCPVNLTFRPTAPGTRTGALVITDNAPGSPHTMTLSRTGTGFTLNVQSGGSTSATVNAGQPATYNLQIEPRGFSGSAALACAWRGSQPRGTSCSVSPTSVNLDGTNAAPFTVTVTTTARSIADPRPGNWPAARIGHRVVPLAVWLLGLMVLISVAAPRRRRVHAGLALSVLFVLLWAACGGGGGTPPPPPQTGTPAGTYTLTVTGTVTTGSGNLSHDITLTLKVN